MNFVDVLRKTEFDQLQGNVPGISNEVKVFTQSQEEILNKEYLSSKVVE